MRRRSSPPMDANDSLFGYMRRIRPFVFSFVPRAHEWYGRAKKTSAFKALAISAWRANSLPLSNVIPEQVKIVGLDDVRYSEFLPVPITTLQQPCRSIGIQAAELMVRRLNRDTHPPRRILFETRLIVRASTSSSSRR